MNLTHWGETQKAKGTTYLQPAKRRPKHRKLCKMRRQRNTQQLKEQGKKTPDQTNEEDVDSLPEK